MPPAGDRGEGDTDVCVIRVTGESSPVVECLIADSPARFLIDTGSKVSLIKEGFLDRVKPGWRNLYPKCETCVRLVGITGSPLENSGCYSVPLGLGSKQFEHSCYICQDVALFPTDGIIGQDILRAEAIDLMTSRGILVIKGEEVPILNWQTTVTRSSRGVPGGESTPVRLTEEFKLPPLSESICVGVLPVSVPVGKLGVLEVDNLGVNGLTGANALIRVHEERFVPVRIANLTQQELTLPRNKIVASLVDVEVADPLPEANEVPIRGIETLDVEKMFELSHIGSTERERIVALITKYSDAFALDNLDLGHCGVIKHRVPTQDAAPVYRRAYRIPYSKREEMERQVNELIGKGIVEHSTSPWGAPALLVEKPDGSFRFVVDYRDLNKVTRIDPYPLPNIQETLSLLGGSQYFTVVDMASGYWQIELDAQDREKTAFNTPSGHYQWTRMPMGLANSAAVWQRTADVVLAGLLGKLCHVYLDDIIVFSNSFEDHIEHIAKVLVRLKEAGLKLKPSKCQFLKPEVKYLGHIISREGVRPDPGKVQCVKEFPRPRNGKEVRQFLGLVGYYRRHIPEFAKLARPLTRLTSKSVRFAWDADAEDAFSALKEKLVSAPILKFPDFTRPFILTTDASKHAVGAILSQVFDGQEHPIAFASRQLSTAEQKYGATEQECLAVVWGVRHFRCYVYGRSFQVITDCRALKWLMNTRDPSSRLARWNLLLQEYDMEVIHKAGRANQNADALSRSVVRGVDFVPTIDEAEIRKAQTEDERLRRTMGECEAAHDRKMGQFFLDSRGLLCQTSGVRSAGAKILARIVIPQALVQCIIKSFHDAPYAGHLGARKTTLRIKESCFWEGMRKDIKTYCATCASCCLRKSPKNVAPAPLQVFQEVASPFERTAMDIMGPLPTSSEGNRYILVFIDHLTRYAEAIAMPDQKAETVARAFVDKVVLRHSAPQQLLTDRGTNFTSQLMREVYGMLGVKKLQTTAYHPQCNGAVERLNHTISTMISHYVAHDQRDWDSWLPYAMFAYNTAVHEGTKETPFYLLYGRSPTIPSVALSPPKINYGTLENYRAELEQRLAMAHEIARKALNSAAKARRDRQSAKCHEMPYRVGDAVYLKIFETRTGFAKKLSPKWRGPFEVVEVLSDVTVRLKGIRLGDDKIVHIDKLKPAPVTVRASRDESVRTQVRDDRPSVNRENVAVEINIQRPPTQPTVPNEVIAEAIALESANIDVQDVPLDNSESIQVGPLPENIGGVTPQAIPAHPYALRSRGPVDSVVALCTEAREYADSVSLD